MEQDRMSSTEEQLAAVSRDLRSGKIDTTQANQRRAAIVEQDPQAAARVLDPLARVPEPFAADSPLHQLATAERARSLIDAAGADTISAYLEHMRTAAGLSRWRLAQKMGWKASTEIGQIESGSKRPTLERVRIICAALGADYEHARTLEGISMGTSRMEPVALRAVKNADETTDPSVVEVLWEKGDLRVVRQGGDLSLQMMSWTKVRKPSAEMEALLLQVIVEVARG